jgi:hypothetical protein
VSELVNKVRDAEIRQFVGARTEITEKMRAQLPTPTGDEVEELSELWKTICDLWKEAFTATRAYYSNNTGPNAKRYREAVKRLKEMKLLK